MRLKRWESPRRQGRNDKGKGGSARQRQLKKQQQMLRKKLKDNSNDQYQFKTRGGEKLILSLNFLELCVEGKQKVKISLKGEETLLVLLYCFRKNHK